MSEDVWPLGLWRCNSHCYELEGSTSCRRREKIQKAVLDASCKIWTVQQARTHRGPFLANHIRLLVDPAVTRRAGTSAMYLWLCRAQPAVSNRLAGGCISHDLDIEVLSTAHQCTPSSQICNAVAFGAGSREPEAAL